MPQPGTEPATQAWCPDQELNWQPSLCGMTLNQLSHTGQGSPLLFTAEQYSILWIDFDLLIHSSFDGHLDFFQFWTIKNIATRKNNSCSSLCMDIFFSLLLSKDIGVMARIVGRCMFKNLPNCFPKRLHHFLHFHQQCRRAPLVPNPPQHLVSSVFKVLC